MEPGYFGAAAEGVSDDAVRHDGRRQTNDLRGCAVLKCAARNRLDAIGDDKVLDLIAFEGVRENVSQSRAGRPSDRGDRRVSETVFVNVDRIRRQDDRV